MGNTAVLQKEHLKESEIAVEYNISREKFYESYVKTDTPVILKGLMSEWLAKHNWDEEYFCNLKIDNGIIAKKGNVKEGDMQAMQLSDYVQLMRDYEASDRTTAPPYYLHDFPLFQVMPELSKDIEPFPTFLFPDWYHDKWWNYICFFMGVSNNSTPMHIDTLLTNNLFFQVSGTKEFLLVLPEDIDKCYRYGWKWSKIDPENPDYEAYPKFKDATMYRFEVSEGDILFMPSCSFHQVKSLTRSISFNIDWHTKRTVLKGLTNSFKGLAPFPNIYYNSMLALGLHVKVPSKYIFPMYKSYFSFIA